ncbi:HAD hydrolase [Kwoniella heveanensis CBS 569]|nr:HAD hydrolase [Kwoniella heveanensis CBS 569]
MPNPLKLKALLIDLNGTLHLGHEPTKGAVHAIERLRASRIPFIFCSNSTKESSASLLGKLKEMGFRAEKDELMTSLGACRQLVEEKGLRRPLLVMSPSAQEEFSSLLSPASSPSSSTSASHDDEQYDSVILGLHEPSLSYESLNKAFRVLKGEPISTSSLSSSSSQSDPHRQAALIAPHASMFQQSPATSFLPAGLSLGIGPFVRALEEASGTQAELVGKPTRRFFELALQRMNTAQGRTDREENEDNNDKIQPGDVGVVGDDVVNDLGEGARELGLKRILVRTGKYRSGSEDNEHPPDKVYDTFADMVDDLLQ